MDAVLIAKGRKSKVAISGSTTIADLMGSARISPQVAIAKKNGRIAPESERVAAGDVVEIVQVVYGG
jgi:sulfur carrier protein ThiS